jgi:hypothetical protein
VIVREAFKPVRDPDASGADRLLSLTSLKEIRHGDRELREVYTRALHLYCSKR